MSKFYGGNEFKALALEWRKKLEESGFQDCESKKEDLNRHNRRTIAFDNRDSIRDFFISLDHFLTNTQIPIRDRQVLELYSQGIKVKGVHGIVQRIGWSQSTVRRTIQKYKLILLKK